MKTLLTILISALTAGACTASPGTRRDPIRQCPVGWVLVCETREDRELSRGDDEEIPAYEYCRCQDVMN